MINTRFYQYFGPKPLFELIDGLSAGMPEDLLYEVMINNAAPLDQAGAGDISFLSANAKRPKLESCGAEAVLVSDKHLNTIVEFGAIPVQTATPRADFAKILPLLYAPIPYEVVDKSVYDGVQICQSAVVAQNVEIGPGSIIGPGAVIGPGVRIGKNCRIGANAVIEFTTMGDGCEISAGAVLGADGFGVAKNAQGNVAVPHVGEVVLGDEVGIGAQTCVDRAMFGETRIGNGTRIDNLVQIGHNSILGQNCILAGHVAIAGSCVIGDNVVMGGNSGVADHVKVGNNVVFAAKSAAMRDIEDGTVVSGIPAIPIRDHMRQVAAIARLVDKKKT